jgi:hypothetical protein
MASPVQRTTLLRLCLLVTIIATVLVGLIAMHSLRSDVFELSAPVGAATTALHAADCDLCDSSHSETSCVDALMPQPVAAAPDTAPFWPTFPSIPKPLPQTRTTPASSPPSLTELSISRT